VGRIPAIMLLMCRSYGAESALLIYIFYKYVAPTELFMGGQARMPFLPVDLLGSTPDSSEIILSQFSIFNFPLLILDSSLRLEWRGEWDFTHYPRLKPWAIDVVVIVLY
jgi:hypothetical protein